MEENKIAMDNDELDTDDVDTKDILDDRLSDRHIRREKRKQEHKEERRNEHFSGMDDDDELCDMMLHTAKLLAHKQRHSRGQAKIMVVLLDSGVISQRQLQHVLKVSSGTMSEVISKLEEHNLITRTRDVDDKRLVNVQLTQQGIKAAKREKELAQQENVFAVLSDEERRSLKDITIKLSSSLEK